MPVIPPPIRMQKVDTAAAPEALAVFHAIDDTCNRPLALITVVAGHLFVAGDQETAHARMSINFAVNGSGGSGGSLGYVSPQSVYYRVKNGVTPTADLHRLSAIGGAPRIYNSATTGLLLDWAMGASGSHNGGFTARAQSASQSFSSFALGLSHNGVLESNHIFSNNVFTPDSTGLTAPTGGPLDFWLYLSANDTNDVDVAGHSISIGLATADGTQYCLAQSESNGVAAGRPAQVVRNNAVCAQQSPTAATVNYTVSASYTATDYTLTGAGASPAGDILSMFGFQLPTGVACKLFSFTTPTVAGQVTYNDPGFKPQFVLFVGSSMEAFNTTLQNDAKAGGFQISAIQEYGNGVKQYAAGSRIKQGANPTNTASAFSEHALAIPSDTSCYNVVADFVSFSNTGFTLDYTTVAAAGKVVFALAIEYAVPECGVPLPFSVGGTNLWLDTNDSGAFLAKGAFLGKTGTGSEIELGPFRYAEQKQADETSMVSSLIIGLTEADNGAVLAVDWNTGLITLANGDTYTDTVDEDWGDIDGAEDIYEDWGLGYGDPDSFGLELMATDDGLTPQHQGAETLEPTEELGSSRQYAPAGISGIFHRLKLTATVAGERFYVKFVDIAGALTGRKR